MIRTVSKSLIWLMLCGAAYTQKECTPQQVASDYWKMEVGGGRLTADGWNKASAFFLHPAGTPTTRPKIMVIWPDYSVWQPVVKGDKADVTVGLSIVGQIDPSLRFTRSRSEAAKQGVVLHLFQERPSGNSQQAIQWKLDEPAPTIWLTLEAAKKYASGVAAADGPLKAEAVKTLAALGALKR
jgi:hypothetical protein